MRKGLCTKNNNQKRGKQHVGSPSLYLPLFFFQPVTCYTPSGVLVVVPVAGLVGCCAAVFFLQI